MWIQETPWEQKNLGVASSAVFHFDGNDDPAAVTETVKNQDYIYQEAVIPMNRIDIVNGLLAGGFRFAEVAIAQSMKPVCELPEAYQRHLHEFTFHPADENEIKQIYDAVDGGSVFQTDKISLNPRFGPAVAARRYGNWIREEIANRGARPYIISYGDEAAGFSVMKTDDKGTVTGLLSGLMSTSRFPGFGVYLGYYMIEVAKANKAKRIVAHVSSNNPSVIKANQLLGYQIENMNYLLTRFLG
ncbi:MAG: hypothetical protein E7474_02800 [Ruminococcaceae bacterium]|nr:hypothetical protein [Oscillospiraceae bacterium]